MICDNCPYSQIKMTAVLSCSMPHCQKDIKALSKRYAQLYGRHRTAEENAEYRMIREEIERLNHHGNAIR
jgi:hypothetical protein